MCKAVEEYTLRTKVLTAIDIYREDKITDTEIIDKIGKKFKVTADYVKQLMKSAA